MGNRMDKHPKIENSFPGLAGAKYGNAWDARVERSVFHPCRRMKISDGYI
jgi:hypothetical protein